MLDLLKKHGIPAGIATLVVLALSIVPIGYQWKYTADQNARIAALEQKLEALTVKK
jgi:hypothetical protein